MLAQTSVPEDDSFSLALSRHVALAAGGQSLQVVMGPAGMDKHLDHLPHLHRLPIKRAHLEKTETEYRIPTEGLKPSEEVLKLWWTWCRWYCVSGNMVGPDGCRVPGAQVTAYSVGLNLWGFTKTPEVTVNADQNGHFTAYFCWCICAFCIPCWPIRWDCWPWWWEFDILHVIETPEQVQRQPNRAFAGLQSGAMLSRPLGAELIRGQGFVAARKAGAEFKPDASRTAYVKNKLANPAIREFFPWWWCCDDPNIVFSVTQGATIICDENPATDTRWCLADGSTVTLVGNSQTITACSNPPVDEGFARTRVGYIPADPSHIAEGYAAGDPGTDTSGLAFAGELYIYAGFGDPTVAYYHVNAGQWTGNPSRGGTAPSSASPISASLNNYVFISHGATLTFSGPIQMGPFDQGGMSNLYATQGARQNARRAGCNLADIPQLPVEGGHWSALGCARLSVLRAIDPPHRE